MKRRIALFAGALAIVVIGIAWLAVPRGVAPSPYASEPASPVRGLSAAEVEDLLSGAGAGYARSAELNGFPGPRHLMDLRNELALSPAQLATIEATYSSMSSEARMLGGEIVARERSLSEAFSTRTVNVPELSTRLDELGALYAKLRGVHLGAHLSVTPHLTPEQIVRYGELRGYTGTGTAPPHQLRTH